MSSIILYQVGSKSRNPKTGEYYDAWSSHIWNCLEQCRKWNPNTQIFMITDDHVVPKSEKFQELNVNRVLTEKLSPKYPVHETKYFFGDVNPAAREGTFRTFYIESLMKNYGLTNVFTFDNDVLVYADLQKIGDMMSSVYKRTAMTPDSYSKMVCGMCYIKDHVSLGEFNDEVWNLMNSDRCRWFSDMELWQTIFSEKGKDYVARLPIWTDGDMSEYKNLIGGIFDPSSIGQHLGGCDNGNPPGCLFPHHYIHARLREGRWKFGYNVDGAGRKSFFVRDTATGNDTKILSIHMHNKKLREFM